MRRYQINSILEVFSRNLDEGLAILRMATELVRTLKAVAAEPSPYADWISGRNIHPKFNLEDPTEKIVFDSYKFSTQYGAHGHKTNATYVEATVIGKEPSLEGVATAAACWFTSFAPMHEVCLKSLVVGAPDLLLECDLSLLTLGAKLLERVHRDPFFHR